MNQRGQALGIVLFGGLLMSIVANGSYTSYVRPALGPFLLGAGAVLVVLGLSSYFRPPALLGGSAEPGAAAGGKAPARSEPHHHGPARAPWLLLIPCLTLLILPAGALGATSVRQDADAVSAALTRAPARHFRPLPAAVDPVVGINDFVDRADNDADRSVANRPVTLTGFLAGPVPGFTSGYSVVRFVIYCCAADAHPAIVHVDGAQPLPDDSWVTAVVEDATSTAGPPAGGVPTVDVLTMTRIMQPADPYEH